MLRLAATHGFLTLEEVDAYREHRHNTAHDYGEGFAHETLALLPGFVEDVRRLEMTLRTMGHGSAPADGNPA